MSGIMNQTHLSLAFWLIMSVVLALNPFSFPAGHISAAAVLAACAVAASRGAVNGLLVAVIFSFGFYSFHPASGIFMLMINLFMTSFSSLLAAVAVKAGGRAAEKRSGEEKEFSSKVIGAFMTSHEMLWAITGEEKKDKIFAAFAKASSDICGADFIAIYERAEDETHYVPVFTAGKVKYPVFQKVEGSALNGGGRGCVVTEEIKGCCKLIKPGKFTMPLFFAFVHSQREMKESDIYIIELLLAQAGAAAERQTHSEKQKETMLRIIEALAIAIDTKDHATYGHSMMTMEYAIRLADKAGLSEKEKEDIRHACLLHDLGKVTISPVILNKPDKLTPEEYESIKKHPVEGINILGRLNIFRDIIPIVLYHHERFDGNGYPCSLKGEEIPMGARICSIADAYSVMLTDRPYKKAMSEAAAKNELKRCAGSQFDAQLVELFLEETCEFRNEINPGLN